MEDQQICPVCNRGYELPRRYTMRSDDIDYLIVPRLLDCLHTCCQSCLEENWEKNNFDCIQCPQCNYLQYPRSIKSLPLDGSAIAQLIPVNGSSMSFCSRCRDEVPSFSWCGICCATLCEFHHQDHKLSAPTSKHNVLTFKVISLEKIQIEPVMPPIPCPEEIEQDTTLYCHDCKLLVSAQAMLTRHSGHKCSESSSLVDWATELINYTITSSLQREDGLTKAIQGIKSTLEQLQKNTETTEEDIREVFSDLRACMDTREREMLTRLNEIVSRKHELLSTQLDELAAALENCRHTIFVAESLSDRTKDIQGGGQYVVSAAHTISRRGEENDDEIIRIPFEPQTSPFIRGYFIDQEISALKTLLLGLGGLLTQDNFPEDGEIRNLNDLYPHDAESKEPLDLNKYKLSFTVQTRNPPKLSTDNKLMTSKEVIVVEARVLPLLPKNVSREKENNLLVAEDPIFNLKSDTFELHNLLHGSTPIVSKLSEKSLDSMLGQVVGQVVFLTEVDSRILKHHRIRSSLESFVAEDTQLPIFRVTREISTGN